METTHILKKNTSYCFFYKFINYTIFLIVPLLVIDLPWQQIVIGYLIMHYVSGFSLAFIFMLAHAVEAAHFPIPNDKGLMEKSWYAHQLYTTTDFAPRNFLSWIFNRWFKPTSGAPLIP